MQFVEVMQDLDVKEGLVLFGRLVLATALGGIFGWDRERRDKPAGLRTHMLVSLGSAAFMTLAFDVRTDTGGQAIDPTRVLQGLVGGLGFLGAGTIIQGRGHVSGLTTAASVWVVGAVGAAAGLGAYVLAIATALLALPVLTLLGAVEASVNPNAPSKAEDAARQRALAEETDSVENAEAESPKRPEKANRTGE
jgi:putative Mg2+ transporter-C (MgtC) family protein